MKYDYRCSCGKTKTRNFPMGKAKDVLCSCGEKMGRVIGIPKYMLNGDGWGGKSRM